MKVLLTSAGRRVELGQIMKREGYEVLAADADETAPVINCMDNGFQVPPVTISTTAYVHALECIVSRYHIDALIPLIDPELPIIAQSKSRLASLGCTACISSEPSVRIAADKYASVQFLKRCNLGAPQTAQCSGLVDDVSLESFNTWPVILKPRTGSAGHGVFRADSPKAAHDIAEAYQLEDYVIQQAVSGDEITMDIFGDGTGEAISVVQRKRLKIRAGEVERGVTVKIPELFEDALIFSRAFKPFGAINLQCFYDKTTKHRWYTEINARFGGGYPLAYAAGANFPAYLSVLLRGESLPSRVGSDYQEGMCMMRYDEAVYLPIRRLCRAR